LLFLTKAMSRKKLRIHNTKVDNLVSNLRGEIGEIIFTWVLLRNIIAESQELAKSKSEYDFSDPHFATLKIMIDKLSDEIVARLSELAETKIGRLTFYFAHQKLNKFAEEVEDFSRFIRINRLEEKRNVNISHKELPETQSEQKYIFISYETLIKGLAKALRLMKKIDFVMLGPSTKYL
jgi:predicted DNA-binding protein